MSNEAKDAEQPRPIQSARATFPAIPGVTRMFEFFPFARSGDNFPEGGGGVQQLPLKIVFGLVKNTLRGRGPLVVMGTCMNAPAILKAVGQTVAAQLSEQYLLGLNADVVQMLADQYGYDGIAHYLETLKPKPKPWLEELDDHPF